MRRIDCIADTGDHDSSLGILLKFSFQRVLQSFGRCAAFRRSRDVGQRIGDFIARTENGRIVGVGNPVGRTDDAASHARIISCILILIFIRFNAVQRTIHTSCEVLILLLSRRSGISTRYSSERAVVETIRAKGRHIDVIEVIAQFLGICTIHFIYIGNGTFIHVRTDHQAACTSKAVTANGNTTGFISRCKRNVIVIKLSLAKGPVLLGIAVHIFNTCILAKGNAATLINIGIHMGILTNGHVTAVSIRFATITRTNPGASTNGDTVSTACISRITNSHSTRLICVCSNTCR